jgi:DNA-binding winged helix-turn-helix (wHTH) protein
MRYDFGECRLDTVSRTLTRDGAEIHLSPKAFDLLRLLIDQRPRVLNKSELMSALWPDTFVVEANLPVIVGELRSALGDRSTGATSIKTHHGIGYSFAAAVREYRDADISSGTGMKAVLEVGHRKIVLAEGRNIVGRDRGCDVFLGDASVSRHHAKFTVSGIDITLVDLGSKNGTRVGGTPLDGAVRLSDGDQITFGTVETRFTLVDRRLPPSTMTL